MHLSMTTDYMADTGCPEPYLRRIAEAGFTHVHWCHQWNTDFLYAPCEVDQIARWLREFRLQLLDLHGSHGREKAWGSLVEYERQAGVALVLNRIEMTAQLGGDAVVMHFPRSRPDLPRERAWAGLLKSLDEIAPVARRLGVRLAIENGGHDDFEDHRALFALYGPDVLGLCYDSGHGNIGGRGLDHLDTVKDRLFAVHLHDNNGEGDRHDLPFSGTIDWNRLARITAHSAYRKCVSTEANMRRSGRKDERRWLHRAHRSCASLARMIDAHGNTVDDSE